MSSIPTKTTLEDAKQIIETWTPDPAFKFGPPPDDEHTLASFTAGRDASKEAADQADAAELALTALRNDRDDQAAALHALVVRAREAFKVHYGADSTQYEQAGGTRTSDRASGLHRGTPAKPAPAQ